MALKYGGAQCTNKHCLLYYAVASRLLVLALTVIWRSLLSPYDTSAPINPPCLSSINSINPHMPPVLFPGLGLAIESSIVWDGVYFARIAQCGYEYEQTYAFLPLLPVLISLLSKTVFAALVPLIGYRAVLGLSGFMLNNIVFVFAALYLYQLSLVVLKDPESAFRASVLFCFNPASIFYSSLYSESLYALLTFGGLYYFMNDNDHWATLWLSLSGCARSNGVLNAGYICYRAMQQVNESFFSRRRGSSILAAKILLSGAIRCLCIFTPFICFQAYGYFNICLGHPVDEMRPWCKARLPLLYNYIQNHYWGVGFLRYFQVKQLPNFLLATPVMSLALGSIVYYVKLWPEVFLRVGLRASSKEKELAGSSVFTVAEGRPGTTPKLDQDVKTLKLGQRGSERENLAKQRSKSEAAVDPVVLVPFVIHLGVMAATAFFVMHVQVATRFLSASPVLYWFSAVGIGRIQFTGVIGKRWGWGHLIWAYCGAYILLGSLLFSNFYPFT